MRQPYYANTLIHVLLPTQTVPTPGENRQGMVLFPFPRLDDGGRLAMPNVVLDTGAWFVHDERASTLPARCPSQRAARVLADLFIENVTTATVDPNNSAQVEHWCKWFVEKNPDLAVLTPMTTPVADALTMTTPAWPTDEAIAIKLATAVAEFDDQHGTTETEASADDGQADETLTEEAS